jgi:hypothetical protein
MEPTTEAEREVRCCLQEVPLGDQIENEPLFYLNSIFSCLTAKTSASANTCKYQIKRIVNLAHSTTVSLLHKMA